MLRRSEVSEVGIVTALGCCCPDDVSEGGSRSRDDVVSSTHDSMPLPSRLSSY